MATPQPTVLPGDGWYAVFVEDDGWTFKDPVICWIVTPSPTGLPSKVHGIVADGDRRPRQATTWTNFLHYDRP